MHSRSVCQTKQNFNEHDSVKVLAPERIQLSWSIQEHGLRRITEEDNREELRRKMKMYLA